MIRFLFLFAIIASCAPAFAGNPVDVGGRNIKGSLSVGSPVADADSKAVADFHSTTKAFLPPRMTTTQKNAISSPTEGSNVYDNVLHAMGIYTGSAWRQLCTLDGTETLTNKSMSGSSNTFTNIPNSATTAASANTASAIVARDGSGNFSASTITAALTGNASTATALAANGTNCSAGQYGLGVDASGNAESCGAITVLGTIATGVWNGTTIAVANGGTGVTSVTTAPAASFFAGWDANKNLSANSHINGYATTATAAGTTTLVVGDANQQYFTGSTTQTVKLPVTNTLVTGQQYQITNLSSGIVTVQSSGANTLQAMAANTTLIATVISTSGTGTASWNWTYSAVQNSSTGGGSVTSVAMTVPAFLSIAGTPVTTSGTLALTLSGTALPEINGGTNQTSYTSGDILYASGANTLSKLAANSTATTKFLKMASSTPTWDSTPAVSDGISRVEAGEITCSTSASVGSNPGSWISSVSNGGGSGQCTLNINAGFFSAAPQCTFAIRNGSNVVSAGCAITSHSTSAIAIDCSVAGSASNQVVDVICVGVR